jgi:hypothetical protein
MTNNEVPVGRMVSIIVGVLAVTLILSVTGLVALGLLNGNADVRVTLTHIIETVMGVFVGIAAGRLASSD